MSMLTISCPNCGFARQLPSEQIPDGPRRVTCPSCKEVFLYEKPVSPEPEKIEGGPESTDFEPVAQQQPPEPADVLPHFDASGTQAETFCPSQSAVVLTEIGELFRLSWEQFQKRFAPLILLYLLTMLAVFVPIVVATVLSFLASGILGSLAPFLLIPPGVIAGLVGALWCYGGFLCALVDDSLTLEGALSRGKKIILPLAWIFLLNGFVVIGGYFLLVIPGIIFTVWFFFAQFILASEGVRGMDALLKSREYVRGQWWNVTLRLLLIGMVSLMVGAVPFFGPLLSLAFFPFLMLFQYLIYRDLRTSKGDISVRNGSTSRLLWLGVALLGWLLVPVFLLLFAGPLFDGKLRKPRSVEALVSPGSVQSQSRIVSFGRCSADWGE